MITPVNIKGTSRNRTCSKKGLNCEVSFTYSNFEILSTGSLTLEINEVDSYASSISLEISSSSSIPNEVSTTISSISSEENMYFRGPDPSIFYLLMTPSIFLTDSEKWEDELKGYHVSEVQDPEHGSEITYSE